MPRRIHAQQKVWKLPHSRRFLLELARVRSALSPRILHHIAWATQQNYERVLWHLASPSLGPLHFWRSFTLSYISIVSGQSPVLDCPQSICMKNEIAGSSTMTSAYYSRIIPAASDIQAGRYSHATWLESQYASEHNGSAQSTDKAVHVRFWIFHVFVRTSGSIKGFICADNLAGHWRSNRSTTGKIHAVFRWNTSGRTKTTVSLTQSKFCWSQRFSLIWNIRDIFDQAQCYALFIRSQNSGGDLTFEIGSWWNSFLVWIREFLNNVLPSQYKTHRRIRRNLTNWPGLWEDQLPTFTRNHRLK